MDGYIIGLIREENAASRYVSHIYKGTFNDPGDPMCKKGWNRGSYYSIWRNNLGKNICKVCLKNTLKEINNLTIKR